MPQRTGGPAGPEDVQVPLVEDRISPCTLHVEDGARWRHVESLWDTLTRPEGSERDKAMGVPQHPVHNLDLIATRRVLLEEEDKKDVEAPNLPFANSCSVPMFGGAIQRDRITRGRFDRPFGPNSSE